MVRMHTLVCVCRTHKEAVLRSCSCLCYETHKRTTSPDGMHAIAADKLESLISKKFLFRILPMKIEVSAGPSALKEVSSVG